MHEIALGALLSKRQMYLLVEKNKIKQNLIRSAARIVAEKKLQVEKLLHNNYGQKKRRNDGYDCQIGVLFVVAHMPGKQTNNKNNEFNIEKCEKISKINTAKQSNISLPTKIKF